jgi:hypothetical protein
MTTIQPNGCKVKSANAKSPRAAGTAGGVAQEVSAPMRDHPIQVPAVLPGPAQVDEAIDALRTLAAEPLALASAQVEAVARFEGDQVLTFEDVGRMYSFARELRERLSELDDCVSRIEEALPELDYVREEGNVDPNKGRRRWLARSSPRARRKRRSGGSSSYMQGVRDAVEHQTGVDPIHGRHDREER